MRFVTASGSILDPALLSVDPDGHSEDIAAQQAYLAALTQPSSEPEQQVEAAAPSSESEQPPKAAVPSSEPEQQLEAAAPSLEPEHQPEQAGLSLENEQQPEDAFQDAGVDEPSAAATSSDGVPEDPASPQGLPSERSGDAASQPAESPLPALEDGHSSQAEASQLLLAPAAERNRRHSEPSAVRRSARKRWPVRSNRMAALLCRDSPLCSEVLQPSHSSHCVGGRRPANAPLWLCPHP